MISGEFEEDIFSGSVKFSFKVISLRNVLFDTISYVIIWLFWFMRLKVKVSFVIFLIISDDPY